MNEEENWAKTKSMLKSDQVALGDYFSYQLRRTPRRTLFSLAYYKFTAKMLQPNSRVLELGCGEGLGGCILSESADSYHGVDLDSVMIDSAQSNFQEGDRSFETANVLGKQFGSYDAVVSLDVIEHIVPENDGLFWKTVSDNLGEKGVAVIGTPNITSQKYASEVTRSGHINLYDHKRMLETASEWFEYCFMFSANDELVHTGFSPMAHYLMVLACGPKRG